MIIRFSRFRFREGNEAAGQEILGRQAASMRGSQGCEDAWLAQGQHPSTEFILVGRFRDGAAARAYEGRLRSDPALGGEFFSLLRLTSVPPEVTQYETRDLP